MNILVTGGAGFIASHIADAYIEKGHRVAVIDNLSTGSKKNINPRAKFYKADIRDAKTIEGIFAKERPQIVNHHAALASVIISTKDPAQTLAVNVEGTLLLLEAGRKNGTKRFIFSSTGGAIYGNPKKIPAAETAPAIPLSPYGLSKKLAEDVIRFYTDTYGISHVIFRYANVYGPRQNPKGEAGVVAIFGALMKKNARPTIFGDGSKTRDYVHVSDVVRANLLASTRGKNETFNIGTGKEVSDYDVFLAVAEATEFTKEPVFKPFRKGEITRISLSSTKAEKMLGWKPEVTFEKGVPKSI